MLKAIVYIVILIICMATLLSVRFSRDWDRVLESPRIFAGYCILAISLVPFLRVLEYRNPGSLSSSIVLSIRNFYSIVPWFPIKDENYLLVLHICFVIFGLFLCFSKSTFLKRAPHELSRITIVTLRNSKRNSEVDRKRQKDSIRRK